MSDVFYARLTEGGFREIDHVRFWYILRGSPQTFLKLVPGLHILKLLGKTIQEDLGKYREELIHVISIGNAEDFCHGVLNQLRKLGRLAVKEPNPI